jgi:hypothetical protein
VTAVLAAETVDKKFEKLIQQGQKTFQRCGYHVNKYVGFPPDDEYQQFRTEVGNLIARVCGTDSVHFTELQRFSDDPKTRLNSYYFKDVFGILSAAYQDYQDGLLVGVRRLVRADLLDDFLSQAEMLLDEGFHIPAASLAGAVLEDTLRKICDGKGITYPAKTNIEFLNTELGRAGVYDKLVQKEITAKADLRNKADHGHFKDVKDPDVRHMLRWIRRFVTDWMK